METRKSTSKLYMGGGVVVATIAFLAILALAQYTTVQHPVRWDLTREGTYTLAPQSKKVLKIYREKKLPIHITAFYEAEDIAEQEKAEELFDQYRDVYPDLTYEVIDPDKELARALRNKIDVYPMIVIQAGEKEDRVTNADEETLTNTLMKMLRSEVKTVYFLKGHGELSLEETEPDGMSRVKDQIEKQNYRTAELVLLQQEAVPEDASIVVIAGPKTDLMKAELDMLREYLDGGGNLMVLLAPFTAPSLTTFLKEFGLIMKEDIIVDQVSRVFGGDYLIPIIMTYIKFPITKNFDLASFFPVARSVNASEEPVPNVVVKELALTSDGAWTIGREQIKAGDAEFDQKTGERGPIPVMAVSIYTNMAALSKRVEEAEKSKSESVDDNKETPDTGPDAEAPESLKDALGKPPKARIVAFGSAKFASNQFFTLKQAGNWDLFMNSVQWLAEDESLIAIRPKSSRADPLLLTEGQSRAVFLVSVVIVPLIWLGAGAGVYFYRRRTAAGNADVST